MAYQIAVSDPSRSSADRLAVILRRIGVFVLALALGLPSLAAARERPDGPRDATARKSCLRVGVRALGDGPEAFRRSTTISATEVEDLEIGIRLPPGAAEEGLVRFRLFMPSDFLYQQLDVPYTSDDEPGERRLRGYPLPAKEHRAMASADGQRQVTVRVPVGGTAIQTSSLYGEWRVEAFVDDEEEPCATTTFGIEE